MKKQLIKFICLIISAVLLFSLVSCGNKKENKSDDDTGLPKGSDCDIDIASLNKTMAYSLCTQMANEPEKYIGKTVKLKGGFDYAKYNDIEYYICLINDETACCASGFEFVLSGKHKYPDDYPEIGKEITVMGTFGTYMEDGTRYCRLTNAKFI